jgi:hypothetical protein
VCALWVLGSKKLCGQIVDPFLADVKSAAPLASEDAQLIALADVASRPMP